MIGPIRVNDSDFSYCRIAFFFCEIVAAEGGVVHVHGKAVLLDEGGKAVAVQLRKAFEHGDVRGDGILLGEGIGDTIRVSLTAKPEKEVRVGTEILRSLSLREPGPAVTSCPTCGRTKVDLVHIASQVEIALETLAKDGIRLPRVAVMGCAVNGPGEAKGADIALCGGDGEFVLYVKSESVGKVAERDAVGKVVEYALSL